MRLQSLLKSQVVYYILGMLFNVVSYIVITYGYNALTPTVPQQGFVVMTIYGMFLLPGYFKKTSWYRCLMLIAVLLLGYGGVIKHCITYPQSPELYHSLWVGIIGISINLYGLILNLIAALGKFK